jgi:hypothetical protein
MTMRVTPAVRRFGERDRIAGSLDGHPAEGCGDGGGVAGKTDPGANEQCQQERAHETSPDPSARPWGAEPSVNAAETCEVPASSAQQNGSTALGRIGSGESEWTLMFDTPEGPRERIDETVLPAGKQFGS